MRACVMELVQLYTQHDCCILYVHLEYYCVGSMSINVGFAMSSAVMFSIGLNIKVQR